MGSKMSPGTCTEKLLGLGMSRVLRQGKVITRARVSCLGQAEVVPPRRDGCALRTPEERLPSGAPKEEFGRMIFQKQSESSLGDRIKVPSATSAGARGGARTCDAPCILGRVLDSTFIQARVRLSCSDGLIYTGRHTFRCHASPPRAAATEL